MDYTKPVVVVSVLVPLSTQSFKEDLVMSDHSDCSHQLQLTASQRLQVLKENALTEIAR